MGDEPTFEEIGILSSGFDTAGPLVNRGDGYFYATVGEIEGAQGGAVIRFAPGQVPEVLYRFAYEQWAHTPTYGGAGPTGLAKHPDGSLYGATQTNGAYGFGCVYRISVDGVFSVVHDFKIQEGGHAYSLICNAAGEIYGVLNTGGAHGKGSLFRIDRLGTFEILYDFGASPDSEEGEPNRLREGTDGAIYGFTLKGQFFRYDGPQSITILATPYDYDIEWDKQILSMIAVSDGFYVSTSKMLHHFAFDGTHTLAASFIDLGVDLISPLLQAPDGGIYGVSYYGGDHWSGIIFRWTPSEGRRILYHYPLEYRGSTKSLIIGNDGLVYGVASFPKSVTPIATSGLTTSAQTQLALSVAGTAGSKSASKGSKAGVVKPRAFRVRDKATQSPNFVPIAKTDVAWLPATALGSQRSVDIDILLNDSDPDNNPLTITSILPPVNATASIISVAGRPRLRYVTQETDPAGQSVQYQLSDGQGGIATGTVVVRSPVTGRFSGTATDTATPPAPSGILTVTMGSRNTVAVTFAQGRVSYSGRGTLELDETVNLPLTSKGKPALNLHLALQRGTPRQFQATLQGGGSNYTATCLPSAK